jgi:hypothetical protein
VTSTQNFQPSKFKWTHSRITCSRLRRRPIAMCVLDLCSVVQLLLFKKAVRHLGFSLRQRYQARTHAVRRANQIMTRRNRKRHRPTLVCRCFNQAYICGGHVAAQPTSHVSMTAHPSVMLKSVCRPYVVVSATLVCQIACYARESSIWIVVSV